MSATRVYAALDSGEPNSPARPTGRIQALPSSTAERLPQLRRADEILQHHDVLLVAVQAVDQSSVDLLVGRSRALCRWSGAPAARCLRAGLGKRLGHLAVRDHRGALAGRGEIGCFWVTSARFGNSGGRTTASAIHSPITTHGHRTTKSPSRWKTPTGLLLCSSCPSGVPRCVFVGQRMRSPRPRLRSERPLGMSTAPLTSATRTNTEFIVREISGD